MSTPSSLSMTTPHRRAAATVARPRIATATNYADSIEARKNEERERLAADTEAFLARGGVIKVLPYGSVAIPDTYGSAIFESHISPPTLPGSAPHDPLKGQKRAERRQYGRLAG